MSTDQKIVIIITAVWLVVLLVGIGGVEFVKWYKKKFRAG